MTLYTCVRILPKASCAGRLSFIAQQCRSIYLMTEVFAKKPPLEGSEITKFVPFTKFKPPDQCIIDLNYALPEKSRRRTTLHSAMKFNINPGWLLCTKESSEYNDYPQYKMKQIVTTKLQSAVLERTGKGSMRSRIFRLSTKTSHHTFVELMATMWYHLSKRQTVEVQVQYHRMRYEDRKRQGSDPFEKKFDECLHLRPDVMLKAMPENCGIVIDPQTDNASTVCWIIGPPHIDKEGKVSPPNNATKKLNKKRNKAIQAMNGIEEKAYGDVEELITGKDEADLSQLQQMTWESPEDLQAFQEALQESRKKRQELEETLQERARLRRMRKSMEEDVQQIPPDQF